MTNNDAQVSEIFDTADYHSAMLVFTLGTLTDADATFTLLIEDGDNSALSDNAAVADGFLLGDEADNNGSFDFADDNKTIKIGYIGGKRYVRATITPANNAGDLYLAGVWVGGHPRVGALSTQQV